MLFWSGSGLVEDDQCAICVVSFEDSKNVSQMATQIGDSRAVGKLRDTQKRTNRKTM